MNFIGSRRRSLNFQLKGYYIIVLILCHWRHINSLNPDLFLFLSQALFIWSNVLIYLICLEREQKELKDTKAVIRICKSKKNRQHNEWKKEQKDKQRSPRHYTENKDQATRTLLKSGGELRCSGRVAFPALLVAHVVYLHKTCSKQNPNKNTECYIWIVLIGRFWRMSTKNVYRFWARPPAKNVPKSSRFEILLPHYLPWP